MRRLEENYDQDKKTLAKTGGRGVFDTGPEHDTAYVQGRDEPIPLWKAANFFADGIMKQIDDTVL
jgi:hypothetical protein